VRSPRTREPLRPGSCPSLGTYTAHEVGHRLADLIGAVLLDEMAPLYRQRNRDRMQGIVYMEAKRPYRRRHLDLLHGWLLRARRERPGCRAAEKGDELPPLHSMTSVASARRVCGMVRRSL